MVSGSYKGASINVNDLIVVGALAIAGFFIYKSVVKPASDITGTTADVFGRGGEALGSGFDVFDTTFDKLNNWIKNLGAGNSSNLLTGADYDNTIKNVSGEEYIQKVETTGMAYNMPIVTATSSSGHKSSVVAAPNTYYPALGIGFNELSQGYSSAFPGNKLPVTTAPAKTTTPTPTTKTPSATDIFTKKPYT